MLRELDLGGYSESSRATYLSCVAKMARHFNRSPADLTSHDVEDYWLKLSKRLQPNSLSCEYSALRFLFDRVLKRPWVIKNIPRPRSAITVPVMLSRDEVHRLIKAARNLRGRTIIKLMYGAGLRVSEVIRLRGQDIDSQRGVINIRESKYRRY